jgi:hypothetical protein
MTKERYTPSFAAGPSGTNAKKEKSKLLERSAMNGPRPSSTKVHFDFKEACDDVPEKLL